MAVLIACGGSGSTGTGGAATTSSTTTASAMTTNSTTGSTMTTSSSTSSATGTSSSSSGTGGMPPVGPVFFQAGSRLQPNYIDYGDGAEQLLSWHDTMLDIDCNFQAITTGEIACVPSGGDATTYFGDAGCTQPVMYLFDPLGCTQLKYAPIASAVASCDTPTSNGIPGSNSFTGIRQNTGAYGGAVIYTKQGATCTPQAIPTNAKVYSTGSTIAPSQFVTATVMKEARGPNMFEEVLQGSDGSLQFRRALSGSSPCVLHSIQGGETCLPYFGGSIETSPLFSDAQCANAYTTPVGLARSNLCGPAEYLLEKHLDANNCLVSEDLYAPGAPSTLPMLYKGPTCSAYSTTGNNTLDEGTAIDAGVMFGKALPEEVGTGRIHGQFYGTASDEPLELPHAFVDTMSGARCIPVAFSDSSVRCVDARNVAAQFYSDAMCKTSIVAYTPGCGTTPPPGALLPEPNPKCSSITQASGVATVSAQFIGQPYRVVNGVCTAATPGANQVFYTLSAPVDLSQFAGVSVITH